MHGTDSIAWKCRYCCATATYECFSGKDQLHVCDTCHELVELNLLYDHEAMANKLSVEAYGRCPVRRSVYWSGSLRPGRWTRMHADEGKPLTVAEMKSVEHRLAVSAEKLAACEEDLMRAEGAARHRLQARILSLRTEKEDLESRARAWADGEAFSCPFKGLHPPTGVEFCLGCTICESPELEVTATFESA